MDKRNLKKLNKLRREIDRTDHNLIKALGERFKAVRELGHLKKKLKLPIAQRARWSQVMKTRVREGQKRRLSPVFIKAIYGLIHQEALGLQRRPRKGS